MTLLRVALLGTVKKGSRDLETLEDEPRHELRKDAKKLRYAAAFFALLLADKREVARQRVFITTLQEVQDQLWALNDLATVPEVLDRLGNGEDPEASGLLATGRKKSLLKAETQDGWVDAARYWR